MSLQATFDDLAYNGKQTEMTTLIQQNPEYQFDFKSALWNACYRGHKKIAELLIETYKLTTFNYSLRCACVGGHKEIAEWLSETYKAVMYGDIFESML